MELYTSDGFAYRGMDEATVTRLRIELGKTTVFVDKNGYDAALSDQQAQKIPVDPNKDKNDWVTAKTKGQAEINAFFAAKLGLE